ncbi:hypothetical protein AJ78_05540 [Emergomyces pasteurianus Ep9510]|uniref:Uncharacterized protein n=1 Tax=Emergomyces pasteurianus Ep9510 TaxID=1447872 RepID=A0A1J9PDK7_9EURO|nr:hypothetical protein AJ78_05540 [Emergomyces pasteurianus Ep9510]
MAAGGCCHAWSVLTETTSPISLFIKRPDEICGLWGWGWGLALATTAMLEKCLKGGSQLGTIDDAVGASWEVSLGCTNTNYKGFLYGRDPLCHEGKIIWFGNYTHPELHLHGFNDCLVSHLFFFLFLLGALLTQLRCRIDDGENTFVTELEKEKLDSSDEKGESWDEDADNSRAQVDFDGLEISAS